MFGVYIHWPYCARICPYCDFNVYKARGTDAELVAAIIADLERWAALTPGRTLGSIHFGGGTPSLMPPAAVAQIIAACARLWPCDAEMEIALEANPGDQARLADLRHAGIERLSLGVQALRDADLRALGRDHSAADALATLATARGLFARVSIDMIMGRSGQTLADWRQELAEVIDLGVDHLSVYQLTIEPGTAFERAFRRGHLHMPDNGLEADLYALSEQMLEAAGYRHYEVSNYARSPAHISRHNLTYWRCGEWVGVGPGAHSRIGADNARHAIVAARTPAAYIAAPTAEDEALTPQQSAMEILLMGLRLDEGVARPRLAALGADPTPDVCAAQVAAGLLHPDTATHLRPTALGRQMLDHLVLTLT